jgi:hypothetical protein
VSDGLAGVTFDCWGTLIFDRPAEDGTTSYDLRVDALARICDVERDRADKLLTDAWTTHHAKWQAIESYGSPGWTRTAWRLWGWTASPACVN